MFFVDREPCFTLLYKLGDVQTYRETYKIIKNRKKWRIMTLWVEVIIISDTSDYCIMTVTLQYHESTWQYMTDTWQTFPDLPEVLGDYRTQTPVSGSKCLLYISNWFLLLLLPPRGNFFYTKNLKPREAYVWGQIS